MRHEGGVPPSTAHAILRRVGRIYADTMFVEGTLRWQVTEDCPYDLLVALCLRDLAGMHVGTPELPRVVPGVARVHQGQGIARMVRSDPLRGDRSELARQWESWWQRIVPRLARPLVSDLQPPHFAAFDRTLALQDLIIELYEDAAAWADAQLAEYTVQAERDHAQRSRDIVEVVHEREHLMHRQSGSFRLDLAVLPVAEKGAWIVGPDAVVVSSSLREDSPAFRAWLRALVTALV